ncbi:hypothetical protein EHQ58_15585 [Leptospira ognonensis]|uniref:Uncharacterized protein n=1 Tax=Leptospira ognonensis TaxID=2484945 RepID=A0A4R9JUV5_9LEPT|nr:hypothetical protein [Leptospira ognonensis]TGL56623.1 hypothetical protein EHQ58_15585 [Leptospira ognonensis]
MNKTMIAPDLLIVSLGLSILFLIGVVTFFYERKMHAKITFYSTVFLLFTYVIFLVLQIFGFQDSLPNQASEVTFLTMMIVFLSFGFIATSGILSRLSDFSAIFLLLLISGVSFPIFFFLIHDGLFFELHVIDQSRSSFLFLASGSMVWFFEVFMKAEKDELESQTDDFNAKFLFFLGLPVSLLCSFGHFPTESILPLALKVFFSFCAMLLGIMILNRKSDLTKASALMASLGASGFVLQSITVPIELLMPFCFVLGICFVLVRVWLQGRNWTLHGSILAVSLLISSFFSVYSVFLLIPDTNWPHSPLVLLGVQTLYLLSIFLVSTFIASVVYFLPKKINP